MKSIFKSTAIGFLLLAAFSAMQSCEKKSSPSISGIDVSGITETSAMVSSNITSDGGSEITARGVVWNTFGNPTENSSAIKEGTGTSYFVTIITGLTPNTTFFVRAYASNGEGTVYSEEASFRTRAVLQDPIFPEYQDQGPQVLQ